MTPSADPARAAGRRDFLRESGQWTALLLASGGVFPQALRAAAASQEPVVLTPAQWELTEALCARIIPGDSRHPGATETGCVNFIDKALGHEEAALLPLYQHGLAGFAALSDKRHDRRFTALTSDEQDALFTDAWADAASGWPQLPFAPSQFLEAVRAHTIIGFLSHPKYGGNAGQAGWALLGYPDVGHEKGGFTPAQMIGSAPIPAAGAASLTHETTPAASHSARDPTHGHPSR
jgi:hypothetical protein